MTNRSGPRDGELKLPARVLAAQRKFEARGPEFLSDPTGPIYKWAARIALRCYEDAYAAGDQMALLAAIRRCANHDIPMPAWVGKAFIERYDKVLSCRIGSWDEAFGRPYPKGKHLASMRKKRRLRFAVHAFVRAEHEKGAAIAEALFEEAGQKFNVGKTLASELYYEAQQFFR